MTWTYRQSTGELLHDGVHVAVGYAGHGEGKNNPAMQDRPGIGPLPRGFYTIGPMYTHTKLGQVTMNLEPDEMNEMFGRSAFRIHGASVTAPGDSSHGCIVVQRDVRQLIAASTDRALEVVSGAGDGELAVSDPSSGSSPRA